MIRNSRHHHHHHLKEDVSFDAPFEWSSDGDGTLNGRRDVKHGAYNDHCLLSLLSFLFSFSFWHHRHHCHLSTIHRAPNKTLVIDIFHHHHGQ